MSKDKDDSKDAFTRVTHPDGSPIRDKDNAAPQHKPQMQYSQPAPNLAPGGAMGIWTGLGQRPAKPQPPELDPEVKLIFTGAIVAEPMRYYSGEMPTMPGYSFRAQVNNHPSPSGIDGGRIERLTHDGDEVARFGQGRWLETDGQGHEEALHELRGALEPERDLPQLEQDQSQELDPEQTQEAGIATDYSEPQNPMIDGRVTSMPGYSFEARMMDEPSDYGINGGSIDRLDIHKDGKLVASYDKGWDIPPQDVAVREALQRIRNGLEDRPEKPFQGFDRSKDKDHGMER
ncbi:hypothetical protein E2K80_18800 [Rhodophyticola sp. CCM32]|uniref:DUF7678 domain-containing protein n=1 Tax=Rhodophyticola sp. CCM32 TaxID=2916397 RepID=UPI00107FC14F|nr:hypothetical protein [Rhodophyticola sp. CCM32]QBY02534.1 hypothetical protein E2K80_18800 [Rhodophyticola sp. CCM32]